MQASPIADYGVQQRRPDASMSLLNDLMTNTLDEDYAEVAQRRGQPDRQPRRAGYVGLATAMVLFGLLMAVAAVQTDRTRPALEEERVELIERIRASGAEIDELRAVTSDLSSDVTQLEDEMDALQGREQEVTQRVQRLGVAAGTVPVTGPGIEVIVDDAEDSAGSQGQVLDSDLRSLVNGLWLAGAEAISINGERITSRTAIGSANKAITINFRSLRGPYVVRAVGDPSTMEALFFETPAGQSLSNLESTLGLRFETDTVQSMRIPAREVGRLRFAGDAPEVAQ